MARGAAASTTIEGAQAASQALLIEGGEAGRAIDAVFAGVLAMAARRAGVLLGSGVLLLGGTGEGARVIDGRARQPGLAAPRPRGFATQEEVPDAARLAVPGLAAALMIAHAGRGVRTSSQLARLATSAAEAHGSIDADRVKSIHAFGRAGPMFLRAGAIRDAMLTAGARSLGGTLTPEDLDAATALTSPARVTEVGARRWIVAPFRDPLDDEAADRADGDTSVAIVAAADTHGAFAIACVAIATRTLPLEGTGLSAPLVAKPILRGVTRLAAATPLPMPAPIGLGQLKGGGVDLALGLAAAAQSERLFAALVRGASAPLVAFDDLLAAPRALDDLGEEALGTACGVLRDSRGDARALVDPRRS